MSAAQKAMNVLFDTLPDTPAGAAHQPVVSNRDLVNWIKHRKVPADSAPHALQAIVARTA